MSTSPHHHTHPHRHPHSGGHPHPHGWWHRVRHALTPHPHDPADRIDQAMWAHRHGIRAVWISLLGLAATAALQAAIVVLSGSVALLGDTLHNVADAATAIPLGLAFLIARRAANRRYTYGYGRAEDLAGILIVAVIAASALAAGLAALDRLRHPAHVHHLWAVAAAALIGFAGNELVARYRINVGRRIGSAALVADGLHARTDGLTSLAVLLSAAGTALGWQWADPVVGLGITAAIGVVLIDAARQIYHRLMDAVDPTLVDTAEHTLATTPGVRHVGTVRLRWIGHRLHAEATIAVDADLSIRDAHTITVDAEHRLRHTIPHLDTATLHTDPAHTSPDPHHPVQTHPHPHPQALPHQA